MDIYTIVVVPDISGWHFKKKEALQKVALRDLGVEPIAFMWNKFIALEARPIPPEIKDMIKEEGESWYCFQLSGSFLDKIEEEVNQWVDDWDIEYTDLVSLLSEIFDKSKKAVFAFERDSEVIDKTYCEHNAKWIDNKIREVLNRQNKLEGFAVTKGLSDRGCS